MAMRGKRYRVLTDNTFTFNEGDVVVALESDSIPWCTVEDEFVDGKYNEDDYNHVGLLEDDELEEIS